MIEQLLQTAIIAAIQAGNRIMEIYGSEDFGIDFKADNSPLTKADITSHTIIMEHLKNTGIPILSEEGKSIPYSERATWNRLWIVDPIDGTKEFIKRNGEFTVNIALIEKQRPIAGIVFVPALGDIYFSSQDMGSFKTSNLRTDLSLEARMRDAQKLPIKGRNRPVTIVASRSHLSKETSDFIETLEKKHGEVAIISKGSSLKLCMVAEGSADYYPRFAPTMEWDTAAGQAICQHSGCNVIQWETKKPLPYNRRELRNPWFIVSNT